MSKPLRVLVVDDSTTYRKIVRDALATVPNIEIIGHAENGEVATRRIEGLQPDVVTLDFEMPELDGLGVLEFIRSRKIDTKAIMLSSATQRGARQTTQALARGAYDFIPKPSASSLQENIETLRREFVPRLEAIQSESRNRGGQRIAIDPGKSRQQPNAGRRAKKCSTTPQIIVIGISTGGPAALSEMLPKLPRDLSVPVLIVQHMPPMFTKTLAEDLDKRCPLNVHEASGGEHLRPGNCYIAPGGKQMKIAKTPSGNVIRINEDPPERSCRPSVDYLFRSVAEVYQGNVLAVIMTGMGDDGCRSVRQLYDLGAQVIAQDEASCTVYGMPRRVIDDGTVDHVCSLSQIANQILNTTNRKGALTC